MDVVTFTGNTECEIAAMMLRQCFDEWVAHALFDAMDFVIGRVYYVDEDVVCSVTDDDYKELRRVV